MQRLSCRCSPPHGGWPTAFLWPIGTSWDGALAVYYVLLCVVRAYLLRRVPKNGQEQDLHQELRCCRATGLFLFGLDLALSGVATQIVRDGYGSNYPGMLIYVAAAYAFYSLTIAIVNAVKYRRFYSPVLSAAKAVNLTTALVSMFNLETAMIAQFGEGDEQFRLVMTACTALAVCAIVLGAGMCLCLLDPGKMVVGIIVGAAGIVVLLMLIPLLKGIHDQGLFERYQYAQAAALFRREGQRPLAFCPPRAIISETAAIG